MMPLAPTPIVPVPSKPKIGFSIDSIVGGGDRDDRLDRDDGSPMDVTGSTDTSCRDGRNRMLGAAAADTRSPGIHSDESDRAPSRGSSVESYPRLKSRAQSYSMSRSQNNRSSPSRDHHHPAAAKNLTSGHHDFGVARNLTTTHQRSISGGSSPDHVQSPSPPLSGTGPGAGLAQQQSSPGIVRPSPNYLAAPPSSATLSAVAVAEQLKFLNGLPVHGAQAAAAAAAQNDYHSQQLVLANFAAAQHFQAAVALQAHHGPPHGPYPHGAPGAPHPHLAPRESMPLYPWLMSRHGRLFSQRYPGGEFSSIYSPNR